MSRKWRQLEHLFHAALEHAPAERTAFLDEACAGDDTLRKEIDYLLSAQVRADSFIERPAIEIEAQALANDRDTSFMTERVVGHYAIISLIGKGGMGEVYLAQDMHLGRKVALKFLPAEFTQDTRLVRRFQQEARAVSALNHPNIITIHEIGRTEGRRYIVTEFVDGETLRQRIRSSQLQIAERGEVSAETGIPVEEVLSIGMQIADALATAHSKTIIHRDIKPENVLLVRNDHLLPKEKRVKLLDFGIAKLMTEGQEDHSESTTRMLVTTQEGMRIGTTPYMSPEQARGGEVDARTDIWSLGIVLFEMLSLRQPFVGHTVQDELASILKDEAPPLPQETPNRLKSIVEKALRKDRDERYQTMKDLFFDLAAAAEDLKRESKDEPTVAVEPKVRATDPNRASVTAPNAKPRQRAISAHISLRTGIIATVVLLLALLAVGAFVYSKKFSFRGPNESVAGSPIPAGPIESLAVLPFVNAGGGSDLEYLSDGMADILMGSLAKLPQLTVRPHEAVVRYKNKTIEPLQIARDLSVQAIVTGLIEQRGDKVILSLRLIDGRSGKELWSKQYSRDLEDQALLQKEIARDLSDKLRPGITLAEQQKVTRGYTADAEAYRLFLKGHFQVFRLQLPEIQKGIPFFEHAIQIDPTYALAYVGLSEANLSMAVAGEMNPSQLIVKSIGVAQKAIDLDDELSEAYVASARALFWYWNWSESEIRYKRALELEPNNANAHQYYAHLLSNIGRHEEALKEIRLAKQLKEYDRFADALEGLFLIQAGKPDEGLTSLSNTIKLAPDFWIAHGFASMAYIDKGMFPEALIEAGRTKELNAMQTRSLALEGYILAKQGKRSEAELKLGELLKRSHEGFIPPSYVALVYNGLGDRNQTLSWLDRGFAQHDPKMAFLKVERMWDNLRNDQQFNDLMQRLGFQ